jgi:hypothetical protein
MGLRCVNVGVQGQRESLFVGLTVISTAFSGLVCLCEGVSGRERGR